MGSNGIHSVLAVAICLTAPVTRASAQVITVESGSLRGVEDNGVESWKGVPFAAAPVGELRWRAPQPAAKWSGIRAAAAYGSDCMQVPFPSDAAPLGTLPAEDCLFLNVWRPVGSTEKLPVVLWIYGGGFVNGGSSPPTYAGAELAKQGVMFVSFNYRVGRFGTFGHPQLTQANADGGMIGNYGYLDQLAALNWVHRNIAAFGGDPSNITIVGESAGGMSVHMLLTSPLSKGLFERAVIMSGGTGQPMQREDLASVEKVGVNFARSKGIASEDPQVLCKLRALSADQVTDGLNMAQLFQARQQARTVASPFTDGRISVNPLAGYRTQTFNRVPVMVGATSADMGGPTGQMVAGARNVAGLIAAAGVPVYAYRFSYVAETIGKSGAGHATDIPFFLDTAAIKYGDNTTPRDRSMARTISGYIANFAKRGDPNGDGLRQWPRYDRVEDRIMDFSETGDAVPQKDPLGAAIDAVLQSRDARGQYPFRLSRSPKNDPSATPRSIMATSQSAHPGYQARGFTVSGLT